MQTQPMLKDEPGMRLELSGAQREARLRFREFVREHIAPHAGQWDREERVPMALIERLRENGYLGSPLSVDAGGGGLDAITYGLLTEELARGCSSVRSTTHRSRHGGTGRLALGQPRVENERRHGCGAGRITVRVSAHRAGRG